MNTRKSGIFFFNVYLQSQPHAIFTLYFDVRRHFPLDWTIAGSQSYHKNLSQMQTGEYLCSVKPEQNQWVKKTGYLDMGNACPHSSLN